MAIVVPITSSWNPKGLDRAIKDIQRAEGGFKKFSIASNVLSASLIDTGKSLTRNVTVPLVAFGVAVNKSINDASNLQEAMSKVDAVFGSESKVVKTWARSMASSFGLSTRAAAEAAGTYGNLFQAFGIGRVEARKMSTRLVELAADMASFNNVPIDEALTALRSGLSGETEPLKRFGVALNDVRLKQVAMNMGLYDGKGTLDVAAKSQAAYALILKDTALQQGDVARTAAGLANQKKFLAAEVENLSAEFGAVFMPIMINVIGQIRSQFLPQIQRLIEAFKALSPQTVTTGIKIALFSALLGPLMLALGYTIKLVMGLAEAFMFLMKRAVLIPTIIATLAVAMYKSTDSTMTWGQAIYAVARGVVIAFVQIGNAVITVINWIIKAENAFSALKGEAKRWNEIKWNLDPLIKGVDTAYVAFSQFGQKMGEQVKDLTGLADGAKNAASSITDGTDKSLGGAADKANEQISAFNKTLADAKQKLDDAKQKFKDFAATVAGSIKSVLNFGNAASAETGTFLENLIGQADKAKEFAKRISTLISMGLSERALTQVLDAGTEAGTKIADEIIAGGATIVDQVNTLVAATESLADQVGNAGAIAFYDAGIKQGQALVDGVIAAIQAAGLSVDAEGNITNPATAAVSSATNVAKSKTSTTTKTAPTGSYLSSGQVLQKLAKIPMMAEGGIVKKPTIAMIGEAGAEAVVPLNKMGKSGATYNITVNAGMGTNGAQVGKEIVDAIKRYERASGPVFASA